MSDSRRRIIQQARQFIADGALIVDTETTGLRDDAEIVEIAIVDAAETLEFVALVKPSKPIPESATNIHGITNEMVENARIWPDFLFINWIVGGRPVLAYNSEFDSLMVEQTDRIYRCDRQPWRWGCLMRMWIEFHGLDRWQRLETVCYQIGVAPGGHRALGDARAAREVLLWLARQDA